MRCVVALAVLALVALASAAGSCSATVRGASYDLTTLVQTGTTDYVWSDPSSNMTYYLNLCQNLVSNNPCGNDGPAYQYNKATGDCFRLGLLDSEWWGNSYFDTMGTDGIVVMYTEGDTCQLGQRSKISMVFHCDETTNGALQNVVEIGMYCHWVVHFNTKYGCSNSSR